MSRLHQFSVDYVAEEDRLLLKVSTTDGQEIRAWLTRRYVRTIWQLIGKLLERHPEVQRQSDQATRQAIVTYQHDKAVKAADFSQPYQEAEEVTVRPAGDEPILPITLKIKTKGNMHTLTLTPQEGKEVALSLDSDHLHSFAHLLVAAVKRAEWQLDLPIGDKSTTEHAAPEYLM
ncbi:MAG: hypothetical protein QF546_08920 [Alphaproteobacteria bacterium]|nr:hypothetical protein [Alphaproteobacteria bacterium]HJP21817.1 hypothetical protein [Alphaproteobacteria bacterium]